MPVQPLFDRIIVRPENPTSKTDSGIILTKTEEPNKGLVLAIGPGRTLENGDHLAPTVVVGDTVLYQHGSGLDLNVDGEAVLVFSEEQLIGIYRQ